MEDLLLEFGLLFAEPSGLPPQCQRDHKIQLLPGTEPVVVRLYHYVHVQKAEHEWQCAKMLHQGTIRPSCSAFSALVLLIKKADNAWHFCVDYRVLNAHIIKDKFPIPIVEELLDELWGAAYFTKLDL
jgi:hypothetical protein